MFKNSLFSLLRPTVCLLAFGCGDSSASKKALESLAPSSPSKVSPETSCAEPVGPAFQFEISKEGVNFDASHSDMEVRIAGDIAKVPLHKDSKVGAYHICIERGANLKADQISLVLTISPEPSSLEVSVPLEVPNSSVALLKTYSTLITNQFWNELGIHLYRMNYEGIEILRRNSDAKFVEAWLNRLPSEAEEDYKKIAATGSVLSGSVKGWGAVAAYARAIEGRHLRQPKEHWENRRIVYLLNALLYRKFLGIQDDFEAWFVDQSGMSWNPEIEFSYENAQTALNILTSSSDRPNPSSNSWLEPITGTPFTLTTEDSDRIWGSHQPHWEAGYFFYEILLSTISGRYSAVGLKQDQYRMGIVSFSNFNPVDSAKTTALMSFKF